MNFKNTKSAKNLALAFNGESKARNNYTCFAIQARLEGHDVIANLFEKMAENEKEHARAFFELINGGLGTTAENLVKAASDENTEWKSLYPAFAKTAREEGFEALAALFEKIAAIENDHEKKFLEALVSMQRGADASNNSDTNRFKLENKSIVYRCKFCGNLENSKLPYCPVCEATDAFDLVD